MKKYVALILCVLIAALSFSACTNTVVFGSGGFSSYVKLGDYEHLKVDKSTAEYKDYFNKMHLNRVAIKGCYTDADSGKVEFGDIANIDYLGKVDGNPFDGGSDAGYDLTIGSGKFIEGFEEGLIGVEVGETVDLNLTFPLSYSNNDLAGKPAVFTVKVNSRKVPMSAEECYEELGFKSLDEYKKSLDDECIENFVIKAFLESCEFKKSPDKEKFNAVVLLNYYDDLCQNSYGYGLRDYLDGNKSDMNSFAEGLVNNLAENAFDTFEEMKNIKNAFIGFYAVFYDAGLSYDEKKLGDTTSYECCYEESVLVEKAVLELLKKNVTIKE